MAETSVDVPEEKTQEKWKATNVWSRIKYILGSIHVEPFVCCFIMARTLMLLATQNLSLQKACKVNLQLSDDICSALENPTDHKSNSTIHEYEVVTQQLMTNMLTWQLIIQSSLPCILAIFMGSWSDRNRKRVPCMILSMVSELVHVIGLLACVYYFYDLPMEVVGIMDAVPTSLAGGRMVLLNAVFSYIGDVTKVSPMPVP